MKLLMALVMLALTSLAMAGASESKGERYVADDIEIVTLPGGEVVYRLVSRNRITARQFWAGSIYGNPRSITIFPGRDSVTHGISDAHLRRKVERKITLNQALPNDQIDLGTRAPDCR